MVLEWGALLGRAEIEAARTAQAVAPREPIVKKEACLDHKSRAHPLVVRQNKTCRPNDVRRDAKQHFPLQQRLAHEAEPIIFEITQPAMNKLARCRRRRAGKIAL